MYQNPLKEAEVISFIKQFSNGYKALLARKVIHRDIKPANILVNVQNQSDNPINQKVYYKVLYLYICQIADLDCSKIYK